MAPILGIYASQISGHLSTNNFSSIATVTVGSGGASSITFSSIPSTYTHLQVRAFIKSARTSTDSDSLYVLVNSDGTAADYANHGIYGNGSTASSFENVTSAQLLPYIAPLSTATNIGGVAILDILDYSNTNKFKTVRGIGGFDINGSGYLSFGSYLWQNTGAINTLYFLMNANFVQYTSFALYGVK